MKFPMSLSENRRHAMCSFSWSKPKVSVKFNNVFVGDTVADDRKRDLPRLEDY